MPYTPRQDSLPGRVCAWMRGNPEEALSRADIVLKFDVQSARVKVLLAPSVAAGLLEYSEGSYSAGPALLGASASGPARNSVFDVAPPPGSAAKAKGSKLGVTALDVDPATIAIEPGVPMPQAACGRLAVANAWRALVDKMQVGDSIPVPAAGVHAVAQLAQKHARAQGNGRKYESRRTADGGRVWRTA